ncbi:MAG: aminotransferase class I/II-fold pyridoxal phosphate-dependent enzyme [Promethearchaeota archaeon]
MDFNLLKNSVIWNALSDLGKSIFQPSGIFYWANRAKKEAEINGTIGIITGPENQLINTDNTNNIPYYIPALKNFINKNPSQIVPYAPITGIPELRNHWKNWILEKYKNTTNSITKGREIADYLTLPVIVHGITFGIFLATKLFANPGESIISPNKRWGNYDSIITRHCEVNINSFENFVEKNNILKFNFEGLEESLNNSFKKFNKSVLILNFPNNPTGYVPTLDEAKRLTELLINVAEKNQKPLVVIIDDAYEGYVYNNNCIDGSLFYELVNSSKYVIPIKLDGASKEMLLYGGRIGAFTIGLHNSWFSSETRQQFLNELENKLQGMIRSSISNCNRIIQSLLIEMFDTGIDKIIAERKRIIQILKERYELINNLLKKVAEETGKISIDPNAGGFFLLVNLKMSVSAPKFNEHLLKKYKTGLIPIEKKSENINALRIAYSSIDKKIIPKLVENIKLAIQDLA